MPSQELGGFFRRKPKALSPQSQNIQGSDVVPVENTTTRTSMSSNTKRLFDHSATSGTPLRRSAWINFDHLPTSVFGFVGGVIHKLIPCGVTDAFRKVVIRHHVGDGQVFESNEVRSIHQIAADLVGEIRSTVGDPFVNERDDPSRFAAQRRAALWECGEFPLCFRQVILIPAKEARIVDLLTRGQGCEGVESNVYTNSSVASRYGNALPLKAARRCAVGFAHDQDEPLISPVRKRHRFDCAFNRAVQDRFYVAHVLKVAGGAFEFATVAIGWVLDRLELTLSLEAWKTRFLTRLYASKERPIGLIHSAQRALATGIVRFRNVSVACSRSFQPHRLLHVPDTFTCRFVAELAFVKCRVVDAAMRLYQRFHAGSLGTGWVESIFVGFHRLLIASLLLFDVFLDRIGRHRSSGSDVVTASPQGGKFASQEAEFLPQKSGGITFELIREKLRRVDRKRGHEKVNVIRHDLKRDDLAFDLFGFGYDQFSPSGFDLSGKKRLAIFDTPNKVIRYRADTACGLSIPGDRQVYDDNRLLLQCQLVNIGGSARRASPVA